MRVVEYEDPIEVEVALVIGERVTTGGKPANQPELVYDRVPGHYGSEWRCEDVDACKRRQAPLTHTRPEPLEASQPKTELTADPPQTDDAPVTTPTPKPTWWD